MFERLKKPYLTVETGEAYQPIRLTFVIRQKEKLIEIINNLKCCEKSPTGNTWNWYWRDECDNIQFESLESYKKNAEHPPRLGTFTVRDDKLFINLPSFKRACLVVPFLHDLIPNDVAEITKGDFINKVFGIDERLPHGFSELFKEDELEKIVQQRIHDYDVVQSQVENASTAEEALALLTAYNEKEGKKRLPFAERYSFEESRMADSSVAFLGFFIFLRSRELVAIRRWFGETGFTLSDAAEEAVEKIFGDMNIDIIE